MSREVMLPDGTMLPIDDPRVRKLLPKGAHRRHGIAETAEHVIERKYLPSVEDAQAHANDAANDSLRFTLARRESNGRSMQVASILGFFNS